MSERFRLLLIPAVFLAWVGTVYVLWRVTAALPGPPWVVVPAAVAIWTGPPVLLYWFADRARRRRAASAPPPKRAAGGPPSEEVGR